MKNIDTKSLIIGALLTSTIFLGVAATSPTDKWDDKQEWEYTLSRLGAAVTAGGQPLYYKGKEGHEPFAVAAHGAVIWRKRVK